MKLTETDTTSKGYCKHHFITLEHVEEVPAQFNKLGEVVKARQGYTIQKCFRCGKPSNPTGLTKTMVVSRQV